MRFKTNLIEYLPIRERLDRSSWFLRYCFVYLLLLTLYSLLLTTPSFAIDKNAGTKNGSFLKIATDARGTALGFSVVATAEGTDAIRWNPAALALAETKELGATYVQYFQDVTIQNVSYVHPFEKAGMGGSIFYLSPGSLEGRDTSGNSTGDFSFYDLVATFGYGQQMLSKEDSSFDLYLGGNIKLVQEKIADESFNNPAIDLGALASPNDKTRIALTVRNLSSGGKANFVREITAGAAYDFFNVFTGATAIQYTDDAPVRLNVSGEYGFPELMNTKIRAGYQTHDDVEDSVDSSIKALRKAGLAGVTFGAGFDYKPPVAAWLNLQLDYAMKPFGLLGLAHTITVKAKW